MTVGGASPNSPTQFATPEHTANKGGDTREGRPRGVWVIRSSEPAELCRSSSPRSVMGVELPCEAARAIGARRVGQRSGRQPDSGARIGPRGPCRTTRAARSGAGRWPRARPPAWSEPRWREDGKSTPGRRAPAPLGLGSARRDHGGHGAEHHHNVGDPDRAAEAASEALEAPWRHLASGPDPRGA
jgi:hypothetical protein